MTNQSKGSGRRSVREIAATVIAVLVIAAVFSITAFAGSDQYDVTIADGGIVTTVTTDETEPIEILLTAGISLSPEDKLDFSEFESGKGGTISITRYSSVNIDFDNNVQTYSVYSATVGEALNEIGIALNEKDELNYDLSSPVKNGMVIQIKPAFTVTLADNGTKTEYALAQGTVSDLIDTAGITLGDEDFTVPSLDTVLEPDMKIRVMRVTYAEEIKSEKIDFTVKEVEDDSLYEGTTEVKREGRKGRKEITYKVKLINGKEAGREVIDEVTVRKPKAKIVRVGTKKQAPGADATPNGVTSMGGFTVGQKISGRYTHYCACAVCNGSSSGVTSSGRRIYNGMADPYYIACNWLPLGTVVNVDGVNYTVVDRGGSGLSAVGRIDIFTPGGHAECYRLGTGPCDLEIVRLGW